MFVLQTVVEFTIAALLIVGLFKEDKVVQFEDKIIGIAKRKLCRRKSAAVYNSTVPNSNRKHCA